MKRIGMLTGGGDCPGLKAVVSAGSKTAMTEYGATIGGMGFGDA